jgi:hypothetical protein
MVTGVRVLMEEQVPLIARSWMSGINQRFTALQTLVLAKLEVWKSREQL